MFQRPGKACVIIDMCAAPTFESVDAVEVGAATFDLGIATTRGVTAGDRLLLSLLRSQAKSSAARTRVSILRGVKQRFSLMTPHSIYRRTDRQAQTERDQENDTQR